MSINVKKYVLMACAIVAFTGVISVMGSPKVAAAPACGIYDNNPHSYAGLIVDVVWRKAGTNVWLPDNNSKVRITTALPTSTPQGNVSYLGTSPVTNTFAQTFTQINDNCDGYGYTAVLGYGNTSPNAAGTVGWALDCDISLHGDHYQTFNVTGVGTPVGAKPGGSWNTVTVAPPNGQTVRIAVHYLEPGVPPQENWGLNGTTTIRSNSNGETTGNINVASGEKLVWRHYVSNTGPDDAITSYNPQYSYLSSATASVAPYPALTPVAAYRTYNFAFILDIPATAAIGSKYCQRFQFSDASGPNTGTAGTSYVCATVTSVPPGGCPPNCGGCPPNCPVIPTDTAPTGDLTVSCTVATGSFGDADGSTSAKLLDPSNGNIVTSYSSPYAINIASYPEGSNFTLVVHDVVPSGAVGIGDKYVPGSKPFGCSPEAAVDGADCAGSIYGWAYDRSNSSVSSNVAIYVDGPRGSGAYGVTISANQPRGDINSSRGISGNHGYSIPITSLDSSNPSRFQNGQDHAFYIYALDTDGNPDTTLPPITMTGCGQFTLTGSAGGSLDNDEAPTSYTVTSSVTVGYTGWAVSAPAVPGADQTRVTRNGGLIGNFPNSTSYTNRNYSNLVVITNPQPGDVYCPSITVNPSSGIISRTGVILSSTGPTTSSGGCVTVNNKPFFRVFNSSVTTGGDVGTCVGGPANAGALAGWYNNGTVPGIGYGSSAQLGAYALAHIAGFASNQNNPASPQTRLSFSNIGGAPGLIGGPNTASTYMGGLLGGNRCITTATAPPNTGTTSHASAVANMSSLTSPAASPANSYGTAASPVNLRLKNPANKLISSGQSLAVYVSGNVYISDNIVYDQYGWTITTVPSFVLSASGNIYISNNVTQLDGTYMAKGSIFTCATSSFAAVPQGQLFANCNNQLLVRGSFVAKKLNLLRTYGSMRDDQTGSAVACNNGAGKSAASTRITCASEVFNFSPGQYLEKPAAQAPGNGAPKYDAITSLPPVL